MGLEEEDDDDPDTVNDPINQVDLQVKIILNADLCQVAYGCFMFWQAARITLDKDLLMGDVSCHLCMCG